MTFHQFCNLDRLKSKGFRIRGDLLLKVRFDFFIVLKKWRGRLIAAMFLLGCGQARKEALSIGQIMQKKNMSSQVPIALG